MIETVFIWTTTLWCFGWGLMWSREGWVNILVKFAQFGLGIFGLYILLKVR